MRRRRPAMAWQLFAAILMLGVPGAVAADPTGDDAPPSGAEPTLPPSTDKQIQRAFEAGEAFHGGAPRVERTGAPGEAIPEHYTAASRDSSDSEGQREQPLPYEWAWRRGRWWCRDFVRIPRVPFQVSVSPPVPFPWPLPGPVSLSGFHHCFYTLHHKD